MMGKKGH